MNDNNMNAARHAGVRVDVVAFKPFRRNTLQGFCDLVLPALGMKIIGATLHEKEGSRWVSLPARPYQEDGKTQYARIFEFTSKEAREAFQQAAVKAIEAYRFAEKVNGR